MSTDTSLSAMEIIRLYGLRFKPDFDSFWAHGRSLSRQDKRLRAL